MTMTFCSDCYRSAPECHTFRTGTAVRSRFVIASTPSLQIFATIVQSQQPVRVPTRAAGFAVERFDERMLDQLGRGQHLQAQTDGNFESGVR